MAGPLSAALKKGAQTAGKKVAKAVPPGAGGFPRGSFDDLLWQSQTTRKGDKALIQQLQQMAGKDAAKLTQLKKWGIGKGVVPKAAGGMSMGKKLALASGGGLGLMGLIGSQLGASDLPDIDVPEDYEASSREWDPESGAFAVQSGADLMSRMQAPVSMPSTPKRKPAMPRPKASPLLSGLTGQNGAGDMSDLEGMNFGVPEMDFVSQFASGPEMQAPQVAQEQKKGNGFMDVLKTLGPLLAALMAGKMMG